jgi:hypothetical protein
MRVRGIFPFAGADDVARPRESRHQRPAVVADRETAGMIEMEMRREHHVDAARAETGVREGMVQVPRPVDSVDRGALGVHLRANPRIDDHRLVCGGVADDQRAQAQENTIFLVGRRALLPQRFRDDAKHRAAVEAEESVEERNEFQIAKSHVAFRRALSTRPAARAHG